MPANKSVKKKANTAATRKKKSRPSKKAGIKPTATKKVTKNKRAPSKKIARKKRALGDVFSGPIHGIAPYKVKRGEKYMSKAQVKHFRAILQSWKNELIEHVDDTVHHMQDEAANFPDPNDRATQESEFGLELRTRDRERKLIKKIVSSLEQIKQADYGYCYSCGIEIGLKRLEARPTATHCIDCKTLDEIKEKQLGG